MNMSSPKSSTLNHNIVHGINFPPTIELSIICGFRCFKAEGFLPRCCQLTQCNLRILDFFSLRCPFLNRGWLDFIGQCIVDARCNNDYIIAYTILYLVPHEGIKHGCVVFHIQNEP
jgi:hypothetical protein